MEPVTLFGDAVMTTTRWHNLAILDYRGQWTLDHIDQIARLYREIFAEHRTAACIAIAAPGTHMSSPRVNSKAAELVKSLGNKVTQSVVVVEERGPLAAMQRGVIRTVNVLAGRDNIRVASSVAEAVPLLAPHVLAADGRPVSDLQLTGIIRRVRERFDGGVRIA
jgi:hypothetical protein